MPRIPDDIGYRPARPVAPVNGFVTPNARGLAVVGQTASRAGDRMYKRQQEDIEFQDRLSAAQAKSALISAQMEVQEDIRRSDDYGSYESMYDKRMEKAREEALSMISDERDREMFALEVDSLVMRGRDSVLNQAWSAEKDQSRALLNDSLERMRRDAMSAQDEATRVEIIETMNDLIAGNEERNYITEQEAQAMRQEATVSYAQSALAVMDPRERMTALREGEGVVQMLPEDMRQDLLGKAEATVDAMEEERQRLEEERQAMVLDAAFDSVYENRTVAYIPDEDWAAMRPKERHDLTELAKKLSGGKTVKTDLAAWDDLRTKMAEEPGEFAKMSLAPYRTKLDETDYQKMREAQIEILAGDGRKPLQTATQKQVEDQVLRSIGVEYGASANEDDNKKAMLFRRMMDQSVASYAATHDGKEPDTLWMRERAESLAAEVVRERSFWFDRATPAFEVDEVDDLPDDEVAAIRAALRAEGYAGTDEEVVQLYRQGLISE